MGSGQHTIQPVGAGCHPAEAAHAAAQRLRRTARVARDNSELWHPLSEEEYRGVLLAMLEEIDDELEGYDNR